jgi:hypothetical protein
LTLEQNINLLPVSAYRDNVAGNQLIPWYPEQNQVTTYTSEPSRILSLSSESGIKRHALFLPSSYSNDDFQHELPKSAYNTSCRLVTPKMTQVGLLINIYA